MTIKDLYEKLKVDFEFLTGFKYKGLIASFGAGVASRIAEFLDKLKFIEKQAFIATADKEYLYLHSGKMLPPLPPQTAEGYVVFYGENGATIEAGTKIKDNDLVYYTMADAQITKTEFSGTIQVSDGVAVFVYPNHEITNTRGEVNGISKDITVIDKDTLRFDADGLEDGQSVIVTTRHTATVKVRAEKSGEKYNKELNDILKLKVTLVGVDKEVGVIVIDGGKDEEAVEDYRKRVMEFMSNPQALFSKNHIRFINLSNIKTLKYVWVESPQDGEVVVKAINKNFNLTQDEMTQMLDVTKAIAPAQMSDSAISVAMPIIEEIDVVIKDLSPASEALREAVKKNIQYIFDKDMYEKGVTTSELEAIIYKTKNGAEEVESFELISGSCDPTPNKFWKLRDVIFQ